MSRRLDRTVLVGGIGAGVLWCAVPVGLGAWPLAMFALPYVVLASLFLAAAYARAPLGRRTELTVWVVPWLAAVGLWAAVLYPVGTADPAGAAGPVLAAAVVFGSLTYLAWQLTALAARQALTARSVARSTQT